MSSDDLWEVHKTGMTRVAMEAAGTKSSMTMANPRSSIEKRRHVHCGLFYSYQELAICGFRHDAAKYLHIANKPVDKTWYRIREED